MIRDLSKKALCCYQTIRSTIIFSLLSNCFLVISKILISVIFSWSFLLCVLASLNVVYHFYFWNNAAFTMAMMQLILFISLVTHFKNQLMGTKKYLSNNEIIKIKVGNIKFEEKKSVCKKYPSFYEILENSIADSYGYIILQRDPTSFKTILQYIRNSSTIKLPKNVKMLKSIFYEAKFFGIEELAQKCDVRNCLLTSEVLKLKVGDEFFEITLAEVRKHPGFYDLLKNCKIDDNGFFILQRDAKNFKSILNFMETGTFDQEIDVITKENIAYEAAYYGLKELVNFCDVRKHLLNSEFIKVKIGHSRYKLDLAICKRYQTFYEQLKTCKIDDYGYFVIQRDGKLFDKIWKYMRGTVIQFTDDAKTTRQILYEAQYYGITELVKECETSLLLSEANAAAYSRSIFNKEEKEIVTKTGAAVVFLEFGFLGKPDTTFDDTAKKAIAQGLIDFMRIRNNPIYGNYNLIFDFTLPPMDEKIALSIFFNGKRLTSIDIFENGKPAKEPTTLRESIKDACLLLSHVMMKSSEVAKQGAKRLAIKN